MNRIAPLSEYLKAQIAAGQVIENPASVLKELIENSLDAGATALDCILEDGGTTRIVVSDNGCGMFPEELPFALTPYSTSKIQTADDLLTVASFGFRGEALASMATVASVEIASRVAEHTLGAVCSAVQGVVGEVHPKGMPVGTRVSVSGLFAAVPARKKFLKKPTTEFQKCLAVLVPLVLAHPAVAFSVTHGGKMVFELPAQTLELRMEAVLQLSRLALFSVEQRTEHYGVRGFIGAPQLAQKGGHRQFLFVNNRPVQRADISRLVKDTFGTLLEPRTVPLFTLFLTVPHEMVDVNVSPKKDTVQFYNEQAIKNLVADAVAQTLRTSDIHYSAQGQGIESLLRETTMEPVTAAVVRADVDPWTVKDFSLDANSDILQVHALYLIAQTSHGIVIIDQHAAHERILYQQFLDSFTAKKQQSPKKLSAKQHCILPVTEYTALKEHAEPLRGLGFVVTFLDADNSLTLTHAPAVFHGRDFSQLFSEFAADSLSGQPIASVDSTTHRTLAFLACRTAIKAGEKLTQEERRRLLEKLFATETQFTCPHGRPVYIDLEMQDLHKLFKRIH